MSESGDDDEGAASKSNGTAAATTTSNGTTTTTTSSYASHRTRLIMGALKESGYEQTLRALERESGVQLEAPTAAAFRGAVRDGDVERALALAPPLLAADVERSAEQNGAALLKMRLELYKQRYLEHLEAGRVDAALACLHGQLAPLFDEGAAELPRDALHHLSALLLDAPAQIRAASAADGDDDAAKPLAARRDALLARLERLLPPSQLLPAGRLDALLAQALAHQRAACAYHNSVGDSSGSDRDDDGCVDGLYCDHRCARYNVPSRATHVEAAAHADEVWHIRFSHDGTRLASASKDATLRVWRVGAVASGGAPTLTADDALAPMQHDDAISLVAWSADDSLLLSCSNDSTLSVWRAATGERVRTFRPAADTAAAAAAAARSVVAATSACAFLPNNAQLVTASVDRKARLLNVDDGATVWSMDTPAFVHDLCVSADGALLAMASQDKLWLYTLARCPGAPPAVCLQDSETITSLALSADASHALVNVSDGVRLWDLTRRRVARTYRGQTQSRFVIRSCFGGVDEAFVASGSEDSRVYIWHRERGALLEALEGHSGVVNCVAWSPRDPTLLASASDDCSIRLWSV